MRISDFILKRLAEEGVTHVPLVYGGAISELVDAMTRQDRIQHVVAQHEQAAGFMAEGMAKATGKIGVAMATSGPGGGNLVTCIMNAHYDSVPMLFITGNVNSKFMRPSRYLRQLGFQEAPIAEIVEPITKYSACCVDPLMVRFHLEKALWACRDERPGPVLLDIPVDAQKMEFDPASIDFIPASPVGNPALFSQIRGFLSDLTESKRPVMLIGGGCRNYKGEFRALAETLQIPTLATWNALDIVSSDLPCYAGRIGTYGGSGRNFAIQNADLVLAIGSRISGRITGGLPETFAAHARKYFVDVDAALLNPEWQAVKADVNIYCDAGKFMHHLRENACINGIDQSLHGAWRLRVGDWRRLYDPVKPEHLKTFHHYGFMRHLSRMIPENAIITADTGGNVITFAHAFETKAGQTYFTSNGNTPMGFSMAAAIGAWFACPDRPVFCLIGDGGFQLNIQELQTIKHYKIPIKVFILNNHILGNTKSYQVQNLDGRCIACGPDGYSCPDFIAVAKAYGLHAVTIDSYWNSQNTSKQNNTMEGVLPFVFGCKEAVIVDVVHHDFCDYQPRLTLWNAGIEEMYPPLSEEEFNANVLHPREGWQERMKQYREIK